VLVAEDDDSVRRMIRSVLERHGYRVLEAANAMEGHRLLEQHPGNVGVLVMDLLTQRLDDGRFADVALARRPDLRVIYLSGDPEEAPLTTGTPGKAVFLQKPFTASRLMHAVRDALDAGMGAGA
jgi:CheY-like chemotaxis protein